MYEEHQTYPAGIAGEGKRLIQEHNNANKSLLDGTTLPPRISIVLKSHQESISLLNESVENLENRLSSVLNGARRPIDTDQAKKEASYRLSDGIEQETLKIDSIQQKIISILDRVEI